MIGRAREGQTTATTATATMEKENDERIKKEQESENDARVLSARLSDPRANYSPLPCEGEELARRGVATNIGEADAASHVVPAGGAAVRLPR